MNKVHELVIKSITTVNDFMISTDTQDIMDGMTTAKNEFMTLVKFGVNYVLIPILAVVIVVIMVVNITKCVNKHGQQSNQERVVAIVICIVALLLVCSFPVWGWQMLGQASAPAVSDTAAAVASAAAFLGGFLL